MSYDCRFKWLLTAALALSGYLIATAKGFSLATLDLGLSAVFVAGLWGFSLLLKYRHFEGLSETAKALSQFIAFSSCFIPLTFAVCASQRPLIDDSLIAFDTFCGIHLPSIVAWTKQHPGCERILEIAYQSVLLQTFFVFLYLGVANQCRELREFSNQLLLSSLITLGVFAAFPAAGPFVGYGFEPSPIQARYLETFHVLRSGEFSSVNLGQPEGLVTFPSFHTTWAIVLAFAYRRNRWLCPISVLLNLAVIVATLTTGWHYFADVLGGTCVAGAAIAISIALENHFEQVEFQTGRRVGQRYEFCLADLAPRIAFSIWTRIRSDRSGEHVATSRTLVGG